MDNIERERASTQNQVLGCLIGLFGSASGDNVQICTSYYKFV